MDIDSIYQTTANRLKKYGIFSSKTIKTVALFAEKQVQYKTYQQFFESVNMPKVELFVNRKGEGVPVVDIPARGSQPQTGVLVIHLPMSNPLDTNQLYHIATVAAILPNYRLIAFGNPSGGQYSYRQQNLTFFKRLFVGSLLHLRPLVSAELSYLTKHKIQKAHHIGYSYGAHKALIETLYAKPKQVQSLTLIDPVAQPRGVRQLIADFKATLQPMSEYVNRTKIKTYFEARDEASRSQHHKYALSRPINIAIGFMIMRLDLFTYLNKLVSKRRKSHLKISLAWGSKSELGNDGHVLENIEKINQKKPFKVKPLRLEGDRHALANDIHLYAAIIYESLLP